MSRHCVIVDGYSAGNLLAPEFKRRGVPCIHVQSTVEIWPILKPSFREGDYDRNIPFQGDVDALAEQLRTFEPVCVLPGTETGVELADLLAERLDLPGNGTARSEARRNKFLMIEACRAAGLRVARQHRADSVDELVDWFRSSQLLKVVVKPLKSAGTDKVAVCTSGEEVKAAAESILGTVNMLGIDNDEALIQEFLEGTEFFLDTVSLNGKHHFTDIWKYQKRSVNGADCVYDQNILCPSLGAEEQVLQEYVRKVLDALDVRFGPAHTEVMLGADGPALVEVGSRLDGLSVPSFNQAAIGYSPVELTAEVFLDPRAFMDRSQAVYPILKHARTVYFTSYEEGVVQSVPGEEKVRRLSSFFQMRLRAAPGTKVARTTNYFTAPGFVSLLHEDPAVLDHEYEQIRAWEREKGGFFRFV